MMKYSILFILITAACLSVHASTAAPFGGTAVIKGKCYTDVSYIKLFRVICGNPVEAAQDTIGKDRSFHFSFRSTEKGMYLLDDGFRTYRLYLEPGEQAQVVISDLRLSLEGENTEANQILWSWDSVTAGIKQEALYFFDGQSAPEAFVSRLEELNSYIETKLPRSADKDFDNFMKQTMLADRDYYALSYLTTPEGYKLKAGEYPDMYRQILQAGEAEKSNYMAQPYGRTLINMYCRYYYGNNHRYALADVLPLFSSDVYKGEVVLLCLERFYSPDDFEDMLKEYGQYIAMPDQQDRANAMLKELVPYRRGNTAPDFTFEDREGNKVSLSDFRGKLVLVDVWATTCRPCVAELPFLKKIKEYFRDKDVVFTGISFDRAKEREVWKKFIEEQALPGIQLFAGGSDNSLSHDYGISVIPRFMLFDREGKIITVDAPVPSDPELIKLIERFY